MKKIETLLYIIMVRGNMKKKKFSENADGQGIIEKSFIKVNRQEYKRRNMLMPVKLTEIEYNVLLGLVEGRSYYELESGIKLNNPKDSYSIIEDRLKIKFEAFTLAHVVYKAVKLGLV